MSDSNSSSLKAYADSAIGAGQSVIGKVTGSAGDKVMLKLLRSLFGKQRPPSTFLNATYRAVILTPFVAGQR